jgi:hypothetical protein
MINKKSAEPKVSQFANIPLIKEGQKVKGVVLKKINN